jgi:protein-L-isoaspartate(D-aspartate) O-methyltransferase
MVQVVELQASQSAAITGIATLDARVLDAMRKVPRHRFVPEELRRFAYLPQPLPVWRGQNTAAPYLVALMTHLAEIEPGQVVFETGTGAGYHAAILAELGATVYSKEVIAPLAAEAAATLKLLGYGSRVTAAAGDGYDGWAAAAPFDAIIVKESIDHLPLPLLQQLKPGGRLVIPLGGPDGQELTVLRAGADGRLERRTVLPVIFSPLQGGERT